MQHNRKLHERAQAQRHRKAHRSSIGARAHAMTAPNAALRDAETQARGGQSPGRTPLTAASQAHLVVQAARGASL